MKFTNASEIGKEILKFNIFLITEYTYRVCIFVAQKFQEKETKIIVETSIKNANVNKIENTYTNVQKLFIKNSTGEILKLLYKLVEDSKIDNETNAKIVVQARLTQEILLFRETFYTCELFLNSHFKRQLLVKSKSPIHIFVNLGILITLVQEHCKFH